MASNFPLENISCMRGEICCIGSHRFLIKLCPGLHPAEDTIGHQYHHFHPFPVTLLQLFWLHWLSDVHCMLDERMPKVLLYVELATLRAHLQKGNGQGHWEVWRHCQQSLTMETWFILRAGAKREETEACCQRVECWTERKQHSNIRGEYLHMHSL